MALSYYTNLAQPEFCIPPELLNFHDNYLLSDTSIDPLFDQTTYIYPENTFNIPSPPPQTALLPPPSPPQTFDTYTYTYPKRIKSQENVYYYPDSVNAYYDHDVFVPNPPLLPEFSIPLPEFQPTSTILPSVFSCGSNSTSTITPATSITSSTNVIDNNISTTSIVKNKSGLSAQSVAARLRRRKITEKTQELGKLIPGGQKMNTAEMFQAASKYIKFLQAQVGMLELMGSFHHNQENEDSFHGPELQTLVTSPLVQEKLYSAEKCLVPRNFVEILAEKREIQSNPQLINEIIQLL